MSFSFENNGRDRRFLSKKFYENLRKYCLCFEELVRVFEEISSEFYSFISLRRIASKNRGQVARSHKIALPLTIFLYNRLVALKAPLITHYFSFLISSNKPCIFSDLKSRRFAFFARC